MSQASRVQGLGMFRVLGLVEGLRIRIEVFGLRVQGAGLSAQSSRALALEPRLERSRCRALSLLYPPDLPKATFANQDVLAELQLALADLGASDEASGVQGPRV